MNLALEIRNAHKRFNGTKALSGADLTLERGQWLALVGPNGAGKTTLIRSITGRLLLDEGELTLLGNTIDPTRMWNQALRRSVGVVPQDLAIYPHLTALENLTSFAAFHRIPNEQVASRTQWALEWTGLQDRSKDPASTFSGGMKRRLNIACGVLHKPELILLDEPMVGVDPQSRERIWEMLDSLRSAGSTLLMTTHQLDEAQQTADRVMVLDHGQVIAEGTLDQLISETVGEDQQVEIRITADPSAPLTLEGISIDGRCIRVALNDVATQLPPILHELQANGCAVEEIRIHTPTLRDVFLHLTGRDLRE